MFANLKNKIREETGSDLSQIAPKLSGMQQRVAAGLREMRNRGSTSSLSALEEESVELQGEGSDGMKLAAATLRGHVSTDWRHQAETLACEKAVLEDEKAQLVRRNLELSDALKETENYKKKVIQYQEDLDQLEGFQTQEMAKIKHLLLEREQQLTESHASVNKLQLEVSRLRGCQEELSNVQDDLDAVRHSSEQEKQKLAAKLEEAESDRRLITEKLERAESLLAASTSDEALQGALAEARDATERRLEETRLELADVKSKWCSQVLALETQLGRLSLQAGEEGAERRRAEKLVQEMEHRVATVVAERDKAMAQLEQAESSQTVAEVAEQERKEEMIQLKERIAVLEGEKDVLSEKCAHIDFLESERNSLSVRCTVLEKNQRDIEEESRLKESVRHLQSERDELVERFSQLEASQKVTTATSERHREKAEAIAAERDALLLRNASLSQQGELACRELQDELAELKAALEHHKQESSQQMQELKIQLEQATQSDLSSTMAELENQLADKNKTIKVLQQRLADMKKTLQKELKCPTQNTDGPSVSGTCSNSLTDHTNSVDAVLPGGANHQGDVNHTYLKHVLLKFLTSREYEAKHLTRAVATLLHFTPEEERLLRETLEWKMSWFGTKPNLGIGQTAKTIPPS